MHNNGINTCECQITGFRKLQQASMMPLLRTYYTVLYTRQLSVIRTHTLSSKHMCFHSKNLKKTLLTLNSTPVLQSDASSFFLLLACDYKTLNSRTTPLCHLLPKICWSAFLHPNISKWSTDFKKKIIIIFFIVYIWHLHVFFTYGTTKNTNWMIHM